MFSFSQAVILATLSASFAHAFNPVFGSPRQCSSLRITWTAFDLPVTSIAVSEITMSLIPLDNSPSRIAPQPYTVAVPLAIDTGKGHNEFHIPSLPFPGGTQFFASAYLPGASGPVRRTVSNVFTVEHSDDSSCLFSQKPDNRGRVKAFGKRQVNVIGTGIIDATQTGAPATSTSATGATSVINVIGIGSIPATGASTDTASASTSATSSAAAASSSTGAVPPIRVIGTTTVPATGAPTDVPANLAPAPSSTGAVPPINVIGTSFIPADPSSTASDESTTATATTTLEDSSSLEATETSTDCTETPTETSTDMPTTTILEAPLYMGDDNANDELEEQPCTTTETSDMPTEEVNTDSEMPTEDATIPYETSTGVYPTATEAAEYDTVVRTYGSLDEMVNAANSMFHAWNPYGPGHTAP